MQYKSGCNIRQYATNTAAKHAQPNNTQQILIVRHATKLAADHANLNNPQQIFIVCHVTKLAADHARLNNMQTTQLQIVQDLTTCNIFGCRSCQICCAVQSPICVTWYDCGCRSCKMQRPVCLQSLSGMTALLAGLLCVYLQVRWMQIGGMYVKWVHARACVLWCMWWAPPCLRCGEHLLAVLSTSMLCCGEQIRVCDVVSTSVLCCGEHLRAVLWWAHPCCAVVSTSPCMYVFYPCVFPYPMGITVYWVMT